MRRFRFMGRHLQGHVVVWGLCWWAFAFFLQNVAYAQGECSTEVKLLVLPAQTQKVLTVLNAGKKVRGQIYLFDTDGLDLLSRGVTIRLRTAAKNDLTVKLRSAEPENTKPPAGAPKSKCEIDMIGNMALTSYSLRKAWRKGPVPETGDELLLALSADQVKLLRSAVNSIDWDRLNPQADIRATVWDAHPDTSIEKISIELWEWTGGQILEISGRTSQQNGALALRELRAIAAGSGLTLMDSQEVKTTLVLHALKAAP
jgi:hypothetical protein